MMVTIGAGELLVRAAKLLLPVREGASNNTGRFVEAIIAFAGGVRGEPWCASFVYWVGKKMLNAQWPLPRTRSCDVLLASARKAGALLTEADRARVRPGMLFLRMKSAHDADHVGIVSEVLADGAFTTVEGNSSDRGVRDGDGVVSNVRDIDEPTVYAFIDWEAMMGLRV